MQNQRTPTIHDKRYACAVEALIRARKAAGLSQLDLSRKIGFSQPDISKIERLERRLDITEFLDILHVISNGEASIITKIWRNVCECHYRPTKG